MRRQALSYLVDSHFDVEPGLTRICLLERDANVEEQPMEPIKLLEVNTRTIPTGLQGVYLGGDPAGGLPGPCIVYDVTPAEFERICTGELALPEGMRMTECFERAAPTQP